MSAERPGDRILRTGRAAPMRARQKRANTGIFIAAHAFRSLLRKKYPPRQRRGRHHTRMCAVTVPGPL